MIGIICCRDSGERRLLQETLEELRWSSITVDQPDEARRLMAAAPAAIIVSDEFRDNQLASLLGYVEAVEPKCVVLALCSRPGRAEALRGMGVDVTLPRPVKQTDFIDKLVQGLVKRG